MKKLLLIIFLLGKQICFSQNVEQTIDSIAKEFFKDKNHAGLSIGVIKNQKQKAFYFGGKYTNQIKDIDSLTLFEIGSITKIYTTFILASLEAEHKINRDDLLSKYLPFDENDPYNLFTKEFILFMLKNTDTLSNYGKVKYSNFGIGVLDLAMAASQKTNFNDLIIK